MTASVAEGHLGADDTGALVAQGFTTLENRGDDFDVFKTTIGSFRLLDN